MNLETGYIYTLITKELQKLTIDKNTSKHRFTNKNEYTSRSITVTIDKETTEEDISESIGKIIDHLVLPEISTCRIGKSQRNNKQEDVKTFWNFSYIEYENFHLMYHITPVDKLIFERVNISDELIQKYKNDELNKNKFLKQESKERTEVNVTFTVIYKK